MTSIADKESVLCGQWAYLQISTTFIVMYCFAFRFRRIQIIPKTTLRFQLDKSGDRGRNGRSGSLVLSVSRPIPFPQPGCRFNRLLRNPSSWLEKSMDFLYWENSKNGYLRHVTELTESNWNLSGFLNEFLNEFLYLLNRHPADGRDTC